jgi:hypothetical protein
MRRCIIASAAALCCHGIVLILGIEAATTSLSLPTSRSANGARSSRTRQLTVAVVDRLVHVTGQRGGTSAEICVNAKAVRVRDLDLAGARVENETKVKGKEDPDREGESPPGPMDIEAATLGR